MIPDKRLPHVFEQDSLEPPTWLAVLLLATFSLFPFALGVLVGWGLL